ncbi:hypothetical protein FRB94_005547 [Tulasnella sp. JGI-2019a]|nr:hypothetical protein FRB94_005547 [Tulasnella sp. JGI-2019a]KAG9023794.1 hypothetical protein FRB95_012480 [Tulasnella sp. JGI-2019a]
MVPDVDTDLAVLFDVGGARSQSPSSRSPMRRSTVDGSIVGHGNQPGLYNKINIIVSIKSHPSLFNFNAGAPGDLRKLFDILGNDLGDPNVLNTAVTDCANVEEWLIPNVNVTVVSPTLENLRAAIASGSKLLKPGGKCLLWFGGFGGYTDSSPILFMADPTEVLKGPDLRAWLMEFHASTEVYVCIDACKAGRFLDLPYVFDTKGNLLKRASPIVGPRLVCVSACHPQEFAHVVRSNRGVVYGGLAWFLPRIIEEAAAGFVFLRDIERLIAPLLSDPQGAWTQRPHVEMSYRDENATISLATIPRAPPRANTAPRL